MLRRAGEIQSIAGRRGRKIARFEMERPQNRRPMRDRTEIACPRKPRYVAGNADKLWLVIARLIEVDPADRRKILGYYVNNVWRTRTFVIFRNPAAPEDAIRYLKFLRALGIDKQHTRFLSFDVSQRSSSRSQWRKALGLSWRHASLIEFQKPPFKISDASKRWLAIEPKFVADASGSVFDQAKGFHFLMVMAAIAFGYERAQL
jgi:hypothetical protein